MYIRTQQRSLGYAIQLNQIFQLNCISDLNPRILFLICFVFFLFICCFGYHYLHFFFKKKEWFCFLHISNFVLDRREGGRKEGRRKTWNEFVFFTWSLSSSHLSETLIDWLIDWSINPTLDPDQIKLDVLEMDSLIFRRKASIKWNPSSVHEKIVIVLVELKNFSFIIFLIRSDEVLQLFLFFLSFFLFLILRLDLL
jgi:hypothetical protein